MGFVSWSHARVQDNFFLPFLGMYFFFPWVMIIKISIYEVLIDWCYFKLSTDINTVNSHNNSVRRVTQQPHLWDEEASGTEASQSMPHVRQCTMEDSQPSSPFWVLILNEPQPSTALPCPPHSFCPKTSLLFYPQSFIFSCFEEYTSYLLP